MKRLSLILALPLAFLGACSPPPFYWTGRIATANRFVAVFDSAAFLDRETGLVWEAGEDPLDRPWEIAREICMNKIIGGRKGWRLPAFNELTSLIDSGRTNPALPSNHPFRGVRNRLYWSSSSSALAASPGTHAVGVDMALGDVSMVSKSTYRGSAKCVRGLMAGPTIY